MSIKTIINEAKTPAMLLSFICDEIALPVEYRTCWSNDTGYLDHAVTDVIGAVGKIYSSVDKMNRKIFIIPTSQGNIVLFQRYNGGNNGVVVYNVPAGFIDILALAGCTSRSVDKYAMVNLLSLVEAYIDREGDWSYQGPEVLNSVVRNNT